MFAPAPIGQQMLDDRAPFGEAARDQHRAVTVERLLLGAHQAEAAVARLRDQPVEGVLKAAAAAAS